MIYIKIIDQNAAAISVEALETPDFVRWQAKNRLAESCSRVRAQGIVSSDGSCIYQLEGREPMPPDRVKAGVTAVIIAEADYDELVLLLDPTEPEQVEEPEQPDPNVMTIEKMRLKIAELETQNAEKDERIEFIEDCLLEMSEVVYADD